MSYFRWWHCGGGGYLKKQRGETFSMGSVVEAGPCVTQTLTLEDSYQFFLVFNSSHFYVYLVIAHFVGAVVWQSGDARPYLGGDVQKDLQRQLPKYFAYLFFKNNFNLPPLWASPPP